MEKRAHKYQKAGGIDFLEGIAFGANEFTSIEAKFVSETNISNQGLPIRRYNGWGNDWFFNQVRKQLHHKNSLSFVLPISDDKKSAEFLMPTKEYLFRHDQGSFWMASYRIPQFIGRLMGPLLDSSSMFKLANMLPWAFPKKMIALQDCMIPRSNVHLFIRDVGNLLNVYPLWLLPMRSVQAKGSIFSIPTKVTENMINIGICGIPNKRDYSFKRDNIALENILNQVNGRKVFYSHSFYSREAFYGQLYDGKKYFDLRKRYHADNVFPEICDKVITKNERL